MMRPVPIVMPELKQRKQEQEKAAASRKGDSVSRRCRRRILLGQGPCALAKSFASTETRRHDVGQTVSAQSSCRRQALSNGLCFLASGSRPHADTHGLIRQCGDAIGSSSSCKVRAVSCQRFQSCRLVACLLACRLPGRALMRVDSVEGARARGLPVLPRCPARLRTPCMAWYDASWKA